MNKPFVQKILAVVLGLALFVMLMSCVSLIMDAVLIDDTILFNNSYKDLLLFTKWTAVALVCTLIPTFVCYAFAFFAKSKIFSICSAVLSLFIAVCCFAFLFTARTAALDGVHRNMQQLPAIFRKCYSLPCPRLLHAPTLL